MDKWRTISRQLTPGELQVLFSIPYSEFVTARGASIYVTVGTFYRMSDYMIYAGLLETRMREYRVATMYRRTIRQYRVSTDGNGGFLVEVHS